MPILHQINTIIIWYNRGMNIKTQTIDNFIRNNVPVNTRYQYVVPEEKHIKSIAELFTESFCRSEPMTAYLNMNPKTYMEFATQVTKDAVADGFSVIALDKNKVIACALVEDFAAMHEIDINFDPSFKYIIALLEQLGKKYFTDKQFEKNYIGHLFITAVDKQYRQQGLSTQINFQAMNQMARCNFQFVYCELTNIINQYGILNHLKNHHQFIGACTYQDFEYENIKPFANLAGSAESYLWEINNTTTLEYLQNGKKVSIDF